MTEGAGSGLTGFDHRSARWARATLVALVTVWSAITSHVAAGGMAPPVAAQLGLLVVVGAGAYLASRWRWTLTRLIAALIVVQLLAHAVTVASMPMAPMPAGSAPRMVVLHGVAIVFSALLLRRGEGLLWSLAERVGLCSVLLLTQSPAVAIPSRRLTPHPGTAMSGRRAVRPWENRGPPA